MVDERSNPVDWMLGLYMLLTLLFWGLALGPGDGGTSEVEVDWWGALANLVLLVPIMRGSTWSIPLLALCTLGLAVGIASGGVPPGGPWFGALSWVAAVMFLLLCGLWYLKRESGPTQQGDSFH